MPLKKTYLRLKRYPVVDGREAVEIKVNELKQLFDERDPSPFREKDLDDDAVDYIVSSVQDLSPERVKKLLIFIGRESSSPQLEEDTRRAIHQFFAYEVERMDRKIRTVLKGGVRSLFIGLGFLTVAIFISLLIPEQQKTFWPLFLKEGLFLTGWVSMWKPLNTFLYDWWPLSDLKKIYISLSNIHIEFVNLPNVAERE